MIGGGAATSQQYLHAGLIDELHLVIVPNLLGGVQRLFDHPDGGPGARPGRRGSGCTCISETAALLYLAV